MEIERELVTMVQRCLMPGPDEVPSLFGTHPRQVMAGSI